jgi:hypothetical protein
VLKVSYRQAKRIYAVYKAGGDAALIHGNVGKKSNNAIGGAKREAVLKTYQEKYGDFGPTLAAETLVEHDGEKGYVSAQYIEIAQ